MSEPREMTREEVRTALFEHFNDLIVFWANVDGRSTEDKMRGLMHSVLATLDGESPELPAFDVIPTPHEEDRKYRRVRGENFFPYNKRNEKRSLGWLHDFWHSTIDK